MMQVEEPSEAQDFVIICKNAPPFINYCLLLHDEYRNDPELSNKEPSFRGMPDTDNPGRSRIEMPIKETAAEAQLIVKHLNGVIPKKTYVFFLQETPQKDRR